MTRGIFNDRVIPVGKTHRPREIITEDEENLKR
jgi:hypothetical protein